MNSHSDPIAFNTKLAAFEIHRAPGLTVITGDAQSFLAAWGYAPQHDEHLRGWRYYQFLQDAKRADDAVRAEALKMMKRGRNYDAMISELNERAG